MNDPNNLYLINLRYLFLGMFTILGLASILGFYLGSTLFRRKISLEIPEFISATVLGFLSLMMAFTSSMVVERYSYRKMLVLNEANAIAATYTYSALLNSPHEKRIRELIKQYIASRIDFYRTGDDKQKILEALNNSFVLQKKLWEIATDITKTNQSDVVANYTTSLNSAFELARNSAATLLITIPATIHYLNVTLAILGLFVIAFSRGVQNLRWPPGMLILIFLFSLVFTVLQDIDRPRSGSIQVGTRSLEYISKIINAN